MLPLPQLREVMSGAAPLGPELASAAMRRLGLRELRQGYGMTEMSPVSLMTPLRTLTLTLTLPLTLGLT